MKKQPGEPGQKGEKRGRPPKFFARNNIRGASASLPCDFTATIAVLAAAPYASEPRTMSPVP